MADGQAIKSEGGTEAVLLVEQPAPAIVLLRLNRPRVHNALDRPTIAALGEALETAEADPSVGVIVLTGSGRSFCSGDDLKALRNESADNFAEVIGGLQQLTALLFASSKPIIAALNGPAYGAGLELVLACDVRIATDAFAAGTPEVRLGLVATNGASLLLPLLIGQSRARSMLLGGGSRDADWCLEAGLVDEIVSAQDLESRALVLAGEMLKGAPGALAETRRMLNAPLQKAFAAALELEADICIAARRTEECDEGVDAHFSRRKPDWRRG